MAIRELGRDELAEFVRATSETMGEEEALAVLANRFCSSDVCQQLAQSPRVTSYYTVRARLVAHRLTPHAHALKFVHHLYWNDLLRLSVDVRVPSPVRAAIDRQLLARLPKLTIGEKITTARTCSREVAQALLRDASPRVFAALMNNPRLREDDLVARINSGEATVEQLRIVSSDRKWSYRQAVRLALVLNPATPRAVAASQLLRLPKADLRALYRNPALSLYLRRCIERLIIRQPSETESLP